ncbi:MAG: hypothetical protein MJE63_20515, partial [Proteobacteria bacterium]|nr:hypothetical protein [Pseudomonadota bacterium]
MKYSSLIFIFLFAFSGHLWAFDTYNPKNNQLSIPIVSVNSIIYSDVIVTIDKVIDIGSSASTTQYDLYDQVTNQLVIPSVKVGSSTYNNVVVTISSVLNIGGILSSSDPSDATFDSFLYSD